MSNLAIDIGNTRIKIGVFSGEKLIHQQAAPTMALKDLTQLATNHAVENIILSSVRGGVPAEWKAHWIGQFHFLELGAGTPLPFRNGYESPETLGKDRLAAVAGAFALFPGQHALVIDAGTCITYDLLEASGLYRGGNIAPGLRMRLRAMHDYTAALPEVDAALPAKDWGSNTVEALQLGGIRGLLLEIEGYIAHSLKAFEQINVLLTGGDAVFLAKKLKSKIFVNQNLVLTGLNKILNYNVERRA